MDEFAQVLLRGDSTLSPGERELIASYVSSQNDCRFCAGVHSVTAGKLLDRRGTFVEGVLRDPGVAPISGRMKGLLVIAGKVRRGGHHVTEEDIALVRGQGASDRDIHDAVLVAAAFCMFNRYVDGLAAALPTDDSLKETGKRLAEHGYV